MPALSGKSAAIKDGELTLPRDYKTWPTFLHDMQRADLKQVCDIYVNSKGHTTPAGVQFPHGTQFVMENYKVRTHADGTPAMSADGKLVKGDLAAIFVMGKGRGWSRDVEAKLATGEWVYSAFKPDGSKSDANLNACRECHVPLKDKDFVARTDEYFATRGR
ncbi:MAG: cytochrome P460 family protein [Thiotrichales bacterium]